MDLLGERPTVHVLLALTSAWTPEHFLLDTLVPEPWVQHYVNFGYVVIGADPQEEADAALWDAYHADLRRGRA